MNSQPDVIVVGAGVVGLMTALRLKEAGLQVQCIDGGPDPTTNDYDRSRSGATFSGGNARHVSITETCPHATSSRSGLIYRPAAEGGWLAKPPEKISAVEQEWMDEFERLTRQSEEVRRFTDDVAVINQRGKRMWRKLLRDSPNLFTTTKVRHRVAVFFLDDNTYQSEAAFEQRYNSTVRRLSVSDIENHFPALRYACRHGIISGGIVEDCIALNAIDFSLHLVQSLKERGVEFVWNVTVSGLNMFDARVQSLETNAGHSLTARNFVLSPGYDALSDLTRNTPVAGQLMGVAGVWIHIPNPGFTGSFKIDASEPTGYVNATIDGDQLALSGGYGFVGRDRVGVSSPGIQDLFDHMEELIAKIFPSAYKSAREQGTLDRRVCVRPMTTTGLPIVEALASSSGGKAVVVGGNSAGGFTQSPVMAEKVCSLIL